MKLWLVVLLCTAMLLATIMVGLHSEVPEDKSQIIEQKQVENSVTMSFVSGTEYKPNQEGQIIVEARYLNGTSAISDQDMCYQGPFNTSSACGGIASTDYYEVQTTAPNISYYFGDSYDNDGAPYQYAGVDVLFNYTKPMFANAAVLSFRTGGNGSDALGTVPVNNFTIPSDCWNYDANSVNLGARLGNDGLIFPFYARFTALYCQNATGWKRFYLNGTTSGSLSTPGAASASNNRLFDGDFSTASCPGSGIPAPYWYVGCSAGASEDAGSIYEFAMYWNMSCVASVWYPDKTVFIANQTMTYEPDSKNAYITFNVPSIDGVYEYQSTCMVNNKHLTASKSFHVTKQRIYAVIPK